MPAVYARTETRLNGVYSADQVAVTFGQNVPATLMQRLAINNAYAVRRFFEIGNQAPGPGGRRLANVYYWGGRCEGQAQVDAIVGAPGVVGAFYQKFGDICQIGTNNIKITLLNPDCHLGVGVPASFTMNYCILTNISISTQTPDLVIGQNMMLLYSHLDFNLGA